MCLLFPSKNQLFVVDFWLKKIKHHCLRTTACGQFCCRQSRKPDHMWSFFMLTFSVFSIVLMSFYFLFVLLTLTDVSLFGCSYIDTCHAFSIKEASIRGSACFYQKSAHIEASREVLPRKNFTAYKPHF